MSKLSLASLSAELTALRNEVIALREELATLKAAPTPDVAPTLEQSVVECNAYYADSIADAELTEYAAIHCAAPSAIKFVKPAAKPSVTYYTTHDGQRWMRVRTGNRAVSTKVSA